MGKPFSTARSRSSLRRIKRYLRKFPRPFFLSIWHHVKTRPVLGDQLPQARELRQPPATVLGSIAQRDSALRFVKWEKYFDFYGRILDQQAETSRSEGGSGAPIRLLEIGVAEGGSLNLWREYFGDKAVIYGIDVDPRCASLPNVKAEVRIGSQTDPGFLSSVVEEMGGVDIVIDDGSHLSQDVVQSFLHLFPKLESPGYYFVEDLHTSYWPKWGGGLRRRQSSIEFLRTLVDVQNSFYFNANATKQSLPSAVSNATIQQITFSDSICAVSKASVAEPRPFQSSR